MTLTMQWLFDFRIAARALRKSPGSTFLAILTIAIGIGANAAMYSVIRGVLIDPLPYPRSGHLVVVWRQNPSMVGVTATPRRTDADDWRAATSLEGLTMFTAREVTVTGGGEPDEMTAAVIDPGLTNFLGVRPALGRAFVSEDESAHVTLISDGLWRRLFGANPDALGKTLTLSGERYTVVGVMAQNFRLPLTQADLWLPLPRDDGSKSGFTSVNVLARLRPGVSLGSAQAELTSRMGTPTGAHADLGRWQAVLVPPGELAGATFRRALFILGGAVAFVLLIGCANVAAITLGRNTARVREIAIRAALGASQGRLVRHLIAESLLLGAAGGGAGLLLAAWLVDGLRALRPPDMNELAYVVIDARVCGLAVVLSVMTAALFGIMPSLAAARMPLNETLKKSTLGSSAGGTLGRRVLTAGEVALASVLLVGAVLLARSYGHLLASDPGFRPEHRVSMRLALPETRYANPASRSQFFDELLASARSLPGVRSAALASGVPPRAGVVFGALEIEEHPSVSQEPSVFDGGWVSPEYFRTLGIPILRGRPFTDADSREGGAVIVNETAARRYWPGESALGKRLRLSSTNQWSTIVGVVGDLSESASILGDVQIYVPFNPRTAPPAAALVAWITGDEAAALASLKKEVWRLDPTLPVIRAESLERAMVKSASRSRFTALVLGAFAAIGLMLAALGIYGVINLSVTQRTREIGVRLALGASPARIRYTVIGEAMAVAGVGITVGIGAALPFTRVMESLLFEVSPLDATSFIVGVAVLCAASFLSAWLPARRAMTVDPLQALRAE
jgi:putative ABC transport system permease protein